MPPHKKSVSSVFYFILKEPFCKCGNIVNKSYSLFLNQLADFLSYDLDLHALYFKMLSH